MSAPPSPRTRRFQSSSEQEGLIARESRRRGVPQRKLFREIVEAGFEAYFSGEKGKPATAGDLEAAVGALRESIAAAGAEAEEIGRANLAATIWASFAVCGVLLEIQGDQRYRSVDGAPGALGMARFMSSTSCEKTIGVWERAGKRLAKGAPLAEALGEACDESGVSFLEFRGGNAVREKSNGGKGKSRKR